MRCRNSNLYPGFLVTEERRTDWMRERVTWTEGGEGGVWFAYCKWWCTRIGNNNGNGQEKTGSGTERVGIRKVAVMIPVPVREEKAGDERECEKYLLCVCRGR